jgi:hypothetical protein
MVGPLLEVKEKENRKLKRLLSERYNIGNDNELLMEEEIRMSHRKQIISSAPNLGGHFSHQKQQYNKLCITSPQKYERKVD